MDERIKQLAEEGAQLDIIEALRILTESYMDFCGISMSLRTVVYECAESWLDKLVETEDHPLSQTAKEDDYLFRFMPRICQDYDPDIYDEYDICYLDKQEFYDCLLRLIDDNRQDIRLKQALCWGYSKLLETCWKTGDDVK